MFKISLVDCLPVVNTEEIEFNFAAYFDIPSECNAKEVIKKVNSHGADFIFVDLSSYPNADKVKSDEFDIPVFILETKE